jgi:spore coat-associated protein N
VKKLLFILMACVLCLGLVGGAFAAFSDTEESTGNTFTAGTLDLTLDGTWTGSGGSLPVSLTNMKPTDQTTITLNLNNVGSLPGTVSLSVTYVEADGTQPTEFPTNVSADEFAKVLEILSPVSYTVSGGATDADIYAALLAAYGNNDGDASDLTVYDIAYGSPLMMTDPLPASGTMTVVLNVQLQDVGNDYQADGISGTFTVTLTQE